jgi:hypothetical protein
MRIYTKDLIGVTRIRKEHQEYPNKRLDEAINEKVDTLVAGQDNMTCRNLLDPRQDRGFI